MKIGRCEECGMVGRMDRHHEQHGPEVIRLLCPPCHMELHTVRRWPGTHRFEATRDLTTAQARAVCGLAAIRGSDESNLCRSMPIAEIVAEFARLQAADRGAA